MGVKAGDKVMQLMRTRLHHHLISRSQVLLPEYGGMQVKIDDKELFMFRFAVVATQRKCTSDALGRRDDEILGVLKSE